MKPFNNYINPFRFLRNSFTNKLLPVLKQFTFCGFQRWPNNYRSNQNIYTNTRNWPKLSIVTPSFNQGKYLETTILSVLNQNYPNLEYVIIDGGSDDNSVEIIKKYEKHLKYWVTEKDHGQSHAINKGMAQTTGDWLAWINSDDYYQPNTFLTILETANSNPKTSWIVGNTTMKKTLGKFFCLSYNFQADLGNGYQNKSDYKNGSWLDFVCTKWSGTTLPQPSSFWHKTMWHNTGGVDESFHLAMDHELYGRFAHAGFRPLIIDHPLTVFRMHQEQKSVNNSIFVPEEIRVVEKWLRKTLTPNDRETLNNYKTWLVKHRL